MNPSMTPCMNAYMNPFLNPFLKGPFLNDFPKGPFLIAHTLFIETPEKKLLAYSANSMLKNARNFDNPKGFAVGNFFRKISNSIYFEIWVIDLIYQLSDSFGDRIGIVPELNYPSLVSMKKQNVIINTLWGVGKTKTRQIRFLNCLIKKLGVASHNNFCRN